MSISTVVKSDTTVATTMSLNRYDRQKRIIGWDQEKISTSSIFLAGVGALGTIIATDLTLAGTGTILLCDFDIIEGTNLNRQILFRTEDIGRNKAEVAKERLVEMNPDVNLIAFPQPVEKIDEAIFKNVDVLVSSVDTWEARFYLNSIAVEEGIPLVDGGMGGIRGEHMGELAGQLGHVQVVIPKKTPCMACQPMIPQEKLVDLCPSIGAKDQEPEKTDFPPLPAFSAMSSTIGGLMGIQIFRLLLGTGKEPGGFLQYNALEDLFLNVPVERNPSCVVCSEAYKLAERVSIIREGESLSDVIQQLTEDRGIHLSNPKVFYEQKLIPLNSPITLAIFPKTVIVRVVDPLLTQPLKLLIRIE